MSQSAKADVRKDTPEHPVTAIMQGLERLHALPKVFSFYLAYRTQKGLQGPDPENIIASVGGIETVGDCRHALTITDTNGTRYRVTVEVL